MAKTRPADIYDADDADEKCCGACGQDRDNYTDTQDRDNYTDTDDVVFGPGFDTPGVLIDLMNRAAAADELEEENAVLKARLAGIERENLLNGLYAERERLDKVREEEETRLAVFLRDSVLPRNSKDSNDFERRTNQAGILMRMIRGMVRIEVDTEALATRLNAVYTDTLAEANGQDFYS